MSILDRVALVVAEKHSESLCVTASVDALHFLAPAKIGDVLVFKASINRTWHTSMEVGVKVVAENFQKKTSIHVVSAYFTFVALDADSKPQLVPLIIPETPLQKRRYQEAGIRRQNRIRETQEKKQRRSQPPKETNEK